MMNPLNLAPRMKGVARALAGGLLLALLGGCTVVGFTAGAVSDGRDYVYERVEPDSLRSLQAGDRVKIRPRGRELYRWSVVFDRYDPASDTLHLHEGDRTLQFRRDEVLELSKRVPKTRSTHYKWLGLGFGLAVDTALLIAIASSGGPVHTY